MGWSGAHLHGFRIGRTEYGPHLGDGLDDVFYKIHDDSKVKLAKVLPRKGTGLVYIYDMGDSWHHEVRLERLLPREPRTHYPRCVAGARACPPEDCGGTGGYEDLLAAIRDSRHRRHKELVDWLKRCGYGAFDPEAFDLPRINARLRRIR